ncbi:S1 family peptidase [Micromonospora sp. LOL_015]|uniref:S1 family peptidase n=1 Tax=Micromonospora sp. LOL_015 TaxID=3345416 RepID=UPI003A853048
MSKIRSILVGGIIVALVAAVPAPASAEPGKSEVSDIAPVTEPATDEAHKYAQLFARQEKLNDAADAIRVAAGDLALSGFAGDRVDPAANTLTVYWHGELTTAVEIVIAKVRRAGIDVEVRAAAYSLHTLEEEADRLAGQQFSSGHVVLVGPAPDGNSLEVGVTLAEGDRRASTDLREVSDELTGSVKLDVSLESPAEFTTRFADTQPYWGGALILSGGACTSGFGVRGINGAARYLLTAAHCGAGQWRTGNGTVIGNTLSNTTVEYDGMLILTNAGYSVYEGPSFASGDTNTGRNISAASTNHVGNLVCSGGSFSGSACGWTVQALNQTLTPIGGPTIRGLVRAEGANRVAAVGNGDSGGPVYVQSGNSGTARGIISLRSANRDEIVPCNGVPSGDINDPNSRQCSWKWWYVDINEQLSRLSVNFLTP